MIPVATICAEPVIRRRRLLLGKTFVSHRSGVTLFWAIISSPPTRKDMDGEAVATDGTVAGTAVSEGRPAVHASGENESLPDDRNGFRAPPCQLRKRGGPRGSVRLREPVDRVAAGALKTAPATVARRTGRPGAGTSPRSGR